MHTHASTALGHASAQRPRTGTPHAATGRFRQVKTALTVCLLGLFYIVPWLRWTRGGESSQAVMFDASAQRLYLFGLEFWPHDLPLLLGLLIFSAAALFFVTSLFGRVWCGFACPQTVWTDLFFAIDRRVDRLLGRDHPLGQWAKTGVHVVVAIFTGFTFAGFFTDIVELGPQFISGQAPIVAYITIGVLTFTTYTLAAHARENVCLHMCPWPRFQAALLDQESLVVTYQNWRGEPRARARVPLRPEIATLDSSAYIMPRAATASVAGNDATTTYRGDCIDCGKCVSSCPTRIDIREGLQLGCIGCGLCIDACNTVMERIGRPHGLINMAPELSSVGGCAGKSGRIRLFRAKPMFFAAIMMVTGSAMAWALATRSDVSAAVEHQRQPPFVKLSDGSIRNDYMLRFSRLGVHDTDVEIQVEGLAGAAVRLSNSAQASFTQGARRSFSDRVMVTVPKGSVPKVRVPIAFVITERETHAPIARLETYFWGPGGVR